jgi:hypothetical protein
VADEYTPTTEQVARAYTVGMRQAFIASAGEHDAEFTRWLAAHDREVAAKALREAAEWARGIDGDHLYPADLDDRADRIELQASEKGASGSEQ